MHNRLTILIAGLVVGISSVARAGTFKVDPVHSSIVFRVMHLNITPVYGRFNDPSGTVVTDDDPAKMSFEIKVPSTNVDTHNDKRDQHLRNEFLRSKQFPDITFKSTAVKKAADSGYEVTGDLTFHGTTKSVTVTIAKTGEGKGMGKEIRSGWETTLKINRSEYGDNTMPGGVGDEVALRIALEAIGQ